MRQTNKSNPQWPHLVNPQHPKDLKGNVPVRDTTGPPSEGQELPWGTGKTHTILGLMFCKVMADKCILKVLPVLANENVLAHKQKN